MRLPENWEDDEFDNDVETYHIFFKPNSANKSSEERSYTNLSREPHRE